MDSADFLRTIDTAVIMLWEMEGPNHTLIEKVSMWLLFGQRVIITSYVDNQGFDVYPVQQGCSYEAIAQSLRERRR